MTRKSRRTCSPAFAYWSLSHADGVWRLVPVCWEVCSFSFTFTRVLRTFAEALLLRRGGWTGLDQRSSVFARDVEDSALNNHTSAVRSRSSKTASSAVSPLRISDETLSRLTAVFKLLADPSRLKIVLALAQQGELHVSALCDLLGQSQPAVSHHLTLMRMVGLVGFRREGKHNYYHLASAHVRDLLEQFFADAGNGQKTIHWDDFTLSFKRK
jgi:DNA-binding transcriptional ArsR family regulator